MPLITPPDLDATEPSIRRVYEDGRQRHGHFDELRRILVRFPPALDAADGMYDLIMDEGLLDRSLKEQIFVACSSVRNCRFAVAAHGRWIVDNTDLGGSDVETLAGGGDLAVHTPRDVAILAFARKMAAAPYRATATDIDTLRREGLDERVIVEALGVVSLSGWMNGYALALGLDEGDVVAAPSGAP